MIAAPIDHADLVDEFVYVANDASNPRAAAIVSGLTIQRRPERFRAVVCLSNLSTAPPVVNP